jgi:plasmid stability protein
MSKMIQLRHVPDALHRRLKINAASEGVSLSEYLLREIAELEHLPPLQQALAEIGKLPPVKTKPTASAATRTARAARDLQLTSTAKPAIRRPAQNR